MDRKKVILKSIKEFKKDLSSRVEIERMIVFGSLARGKFTKDSDIDLIIVSKSFRNKLFHKRGLSFDKFWKIDYPFDFICLSPEEFENMRKRISIVSLAEKEGVEI